jgi:hypothetical protein
MRMQAIWAAAYENDLRALKSLHFKASVCSRTINMSFVERRHGTVRGQNARRSRRR